MTTIHFTSSIRLTRNVNIHTQRINIIKTSGAFDIKDFSLWFVGYLFDLYTASTVGVLAAESTARAAAVDLSCSRSCVVDDCVRCTVGPLIDRSETIAACSTEQNQSRRPTIHSLSVCLSVCLVCLCSPYTNEVLRGCDAMKQEQASCPKFCDVGTMYYFMTHFYGTISIHWNNGSYFTSGLRLPVSQINGVSRRS